jgi:hypothetical protein
MTVWKNATDEDMPHAHCMLHTQACNRTLRICNTYCFSTATMAARTHLKLRYGTVRVLLEFCGLLAVR